MRTTTGASDHVVIVGAGLGGLSAALRLAGAGRKVTVIEREAVPGGRNGLLQDSGYSFDTGPTVLTMPDLIADALDCVGESMDDWLELLPIEPLYRSFYADGSQLDVHADPARMAQEIESVIGANEAAGYLRYVDFVTDLYKYEMRDFIDRNIGSPFDLVTPNLARLVGIGGFRKLSPKVEQYLKDPRTQRIFSFQSMYAGLAPQDALAIYAVIAYMDSVAGVFMPKGGMHADRIACDAVILNPDLPVAYRDLLGFEPWDVKRLNYSPSCYLLLTGSTQEYSQIAHHNIHFGKSWDGVFKDLIDDKKLMSDPSILVTNPSRTDPGLAPDGKHIYYVLFPTPNLDADIDWTKQSGPYRDEIVKTLEERGYVGFGDSIELEHITNPLDWQERGMERGTPFAAAHSFFQTGPFRPHNVWGDNVVFAGSGTQPGVGVPMVLISGRLAAERITGPDPAYKSRAWM